MAQVLREGVARWFGHRCNVLGHERVVQLFFLEYLENAHYLEEEHGPRVLELQAGGVEPGEPLARAACAGDHLDRIHPAE